MDQGRDRSVVIGAEKESGGGGGLRVRPDHAPRGLSPPPNLQGPAPAHLICPALVVLFKAYL
jgi:hypothetical protein